MPSTREVLQGRLLASVNSIPGRYSPSPGASSKRPALGRLQHPASSAPWPDPGPACAGPAQNRGYSSSVGTPAGRPPGPVSPRSCHPSVKACASPPTSSRRITSTRAHSGGGTDEGNRSLLSPVSSCLGLGHLQSEMTGDSNQQTHGQPFRRPQLRGKGDARRRSVAADGERNEHPNE